MIIAVRILVVLAKKMFFPVLSLETLGPIQLRKDRIARR